MTRASDRNPERYPRTRPRISIAYAVGQRPVMMINAPMVAITAIHERAAM